MWAIFRLRSNFSGAAIKDVWGVFFGYWWLGGRGEGRGSEISFVSIVGTVVMGGITGGLPLVFFVHVSKWNSIIILRV